ncbi:MAG: hypothetical protein IIY03_04200 [Muribaculaceae bacterium]|nr:hypothetical protein [Muribaculaceae bacterium]
MFKQSFIRAMIAGAIFVLLEWIGDKYLFKHNSPIYMYLIEGVIFIVLITLIYYFILKRQNRKDKYK